MTWALLGVTGEVVSFAEEPFVMARQPRVFGMGPVSVGTKEQPALSAGDGRGTSKALGWPLAFELNILSDSHLGLLQSVERLARLFDPSRGDCVLMFDRPDGERRELVCHYTGGLNPPIEGAWSRETAVEVMMRAPHPFYRSASPAGVTLDFPVSGSGFEATPFSDDTVAFSDASVPFNGWESSVEEGTVLATLTNAGSAPAWPLWRFTGPIAGVEVANLTTGRAWSWTREPWSELLVGETLEVRTAEQSDAVRLTDGTNRYRGLAASSRDLWPLAPGDNLVLIQAIGAGSSTTASVEFHPEWLTC